MSVLEQEIIEKLCQLDQDAKQRILVVVQGELNLDIVMALL